MKRIKIFDCFVRSVNCILTRKIMYGHAHARAHAAGTHFNNRLPMARFLFSSFSYVARSRRALSFMTIYLTIDNNKFGSYLDYPSDLRNYKRTFFFFLYVQLSTRTKNVVPGRRRRPWGISVRPERASSLIELVSFLVSGRHVKKHRGV